MNIIIFGTSQFSKLVKRYIEEDSENVVIAFTVNEDYLQEREFAGVPVIAFEDLEKIFPNQQINILITCGYKNMNDIRKKIYYECKKKNYVVCDFVHSSSIIETRSWGEGNIVLPHVHVGPYVNIGDGNIFFSDVIINHDTQVGDFNYFSPAFVCGGACKMGDNNFFGLRSVLRDSISIGNYNIIGAATYLSDSIGNSNLVKMSKCVIEQVERSVLDKLL